MSHFEKCWSQRLSWADHHGNRVITQLGVYKTHSHDTIMVLYDGDCIARCARERDRKRERVLVVVLVSEVYISALSCREHFPSFLATDYIVVVFCTIVLMLHWGRTLKAKRPIIRLCTQRSITAE